MNETASKEVSKDTQLCKFVTVGICTSQPIISGSDSSSESTSADVEEETLDQKKIPRPGMQGVL